MTKTKQHTLQPVRIHADIAMSAPLFFTFPFLFPSPLPLPLCVLSYHMFLRFPTLIRFHLASSQFNPFTYYNLLLQLLLLLNSNFTRTPAPSPSAFLSRSTPLPRLASLGGRGPDKSEVDGEGLVEQLGVVHAVDGGFGFFLGGEFDECVTL